MNITILDLDSIGKDLDLSPITSLGQCRFYNSTSPEELPHRLQNTQVAVINKIKMTRSILERAPDLKLICVAATGFDNIDLQCCRERGIAVTNVPGYSTDSVAMVTVATVLSLMIHLQEYRDFVTSGDYTRSGIPNRLSPAFSDLRGKTWGIVGYGSIGRQVAQVARAFGCRVIYCRNTPSAEPDCCNMDTLCTESDIITLHCPLNEATRELIDRRRLDMMKKNTILVNAARGAVCQEAAVAQAVLEGRLGAFGCDVYSTEPFGPEHPYQTLLGRPNVCLTPHIAWASYEARTTVVREVAENIQAFCQGSSRNRVDLQQPDFC